MKKYDTIIFDLDGTLLNTLEDLTDSVNYVLASFGYPQHSLTAIRSFVGNGLRQLIELSVPDGKDNPRFNEAFDLFTRHYLDNCMNKTGPYPGIMELLSELSVKGYKLAVVSNKFDDAVKDLNRQFFSKYVSVAAGEKKGVRRKPAPDSVFQVLRELNSTEDRTIYVGDSTVDIQTAKNAGVECISVSWGFCERDVLISSGANTIIDSPEELLRLI